MMDIVVVLEDGGEITVKGVTAVRDFTPFGLGQWYRVYGKDDKEIAFFKNLKYWYKIEANDNGCSG